MKRYGIWIPERVLVPTVYVTEPDDFGQIDLVAKRRGLTWAHAVNRANRWRRAHGDPR